MCGRQSGSLYVSGPPGTGKSASINHLLDSRPVSLCPASCDEWMPTITGNSPMQVFLISCFCLVVSFKHKSYNRLYQPSSVILQQSSFKIFPVSPIQLPPLSQDLTPNAAVVVLNCMTLRSPQAIFSCLLEQLQPLTGGRRGKLQMKGAQDRLAHIITHSKKIM